MKSSSGHRLPIKQAFIGNIGVKKHSMGECPIYIVDTNADNGTLPYDFIIGRQGLVATGYTDLNLLTGVCRNPTLKTKFMAGPIDMQGKHTDKFIPTAMVNIDDYGNATAAMEPIQAIKQAGKDEVKDKKDETQPCSVHSNNIQINEKLADYVLDKHVCVVCYMPNSNVCCKQCKQVYYCSDQHRRVHAHAHGKKCAKIKVINASITCDNSKLSSPSIRINNDKELKKRQEARQQERYDFVKSLYEGQVEDNRIDQADAKILLNYVHNNIHLMALGSEDESDIKSKEEQEMDKEFEMNKEMYSSTFSNMINISKQLTHTVYLVQ